NPMEDGERFENLAVGFPHLTIQKPNWEFSAERDWCAPFEDDNEIWASTIEYSEFNISIPSTVSLEFLYFKKRIVNVCFDKKNECSWEIQRFWDAEFYQSIIHNSLVRRAKSREQF